MICVLLSAGSVKTTAQSIREVEGVGRGYPEEQAYTNARLNALQKFGVRIHSVFTEFTSGSLNEVDRSRDFFMIARSSGLVYDEDTVSPAKLLPGDQTGQKPLYEVVLRVKIKEISAEDKYFRVGLSLEPARSTYYAGQQLQLLVTTSKDCYINIFSISSDNQAFVVFPNFIRSDNRLLAHDTLTVGNLEMSLTEKQKEGNEVLLVVATKAQIKFVDYEDPNSWQKIAQKNGSYLAVSPVGIASRIIQRLTTLGDDQWTTARYAYALRR